MSLSASFLITRESSVELYTYPDGPPILALNDPGAHLSVSCPESRESITAGLRFAEHLVAAVTEYRAAMDAYAAGLPTAGGAL
jgi:hypothetical protein